MPVDADSPAGTSAKGGGVMNLTRRRTATVSCAGWRPELGAEAILSGDFHRIEQPET